MASVEQQTVLGGLDTYMVRSDKASSGVIFTLDPE